MNIDLHELAEAELLEAAGWYEDRSAGLGHVFLDEFERCPARGDRGTGREDSESPLPLPPLGRRRRAIFGMYKALLGGVPGVEFMPEAPWGECTRWLTIALISPESFGADREAVRLALEAGNIEARPVWKPMHLQPVFKGARVRAGAVAADLFERGLCLPSGTGMTQGDVQRVGDVARVVDVVRRVAKLG